MQGSSLTQDVVRLVARAWRFADSEPDSALHSARKAAESICLHVFMDRVSATPGHMSLEDLIGKLLRAQALPQSLVLPLKTVQTYGNFGTHQQTDATRIDGRAVRTCLSALDEVVGWYFTTYLGVEVPSELSRVGDGGSPRRDTPIPSAVEAEARLRDRPVALLATTRTVVVGTDQGEWCSVDAANRLQSLPATGPFGAAVVDPNGSIVVSCWAPSVKQLRAGDDAWQEIMLGASPLVLVATDRGVIAGDTGGGLAIVPTSSKISVQDLTATEPIVELCSLGDGLAVLGASGALDITGWPYRDLASSPYRDSTQLVRVDTSAIGRVYAIYPGVRTGSAIVAGRRGWAVLSGSTLGFVVEGAPPLRGVARLANDRACVYTDEGDAWIVDASLQRTNRLRLPDASVSGAVSSPDGNALVWTHEGNLCSVASDGGMRRIAERDVALATPDPERTTGYIAVHWTATEGARVTRGKSAWT